MSLRRQLPAYSPLSAGALRAGLIGSSGNRAAFSALESRIRAEYGSNAVLLTDSGTSALALAMAGAGQRGNRPPRVLLPAYGCYDLATAADAADAEVLLYDLDPATLSPDLDSLDRALAQGAEAIVVVHLYGVPVDLAAIQEAARRAGALLIEDAAQGVGASVGSRPAGGVGSLGVLSFGRGKGRTGGGGGALLANDPAGLAALERVRSRLLPARGGGSQDWIALAAQWLLGRPTLYGLPAALPWLGLGETPYHPAHPPRSMSGLSARVLGITWALAAAEAEHRRTSGGWWLDRLRGSGMATPVRPPAGTTPGWLRFPVLATAASRSLLGEQAFRRMGVMSGYPLPLGRLPGFEARVVNPESPAPGAARLADSLFTLPTHSLVSPAERAVLARMLGVLEA